MPEQTFEERLAQRLSTYAESGVRPFDPHAVAKATIASRSRWGRLPRPMPWQGSTARSLRLVLTVSLMLALLLVAMLASGALVPGGKQPSSSGLFVWANGVATFVGQDGEIATRSAASPRGDGCPVLIGNSSLIAQGGYGEIHLTDLVGDVDVPAIDTNYAGGERWSPDHRLLALYRHEGTVTVVSFEASGATPQTTFDAPGVVDVAWAAGGRYLAVTRQDSDRTVELVDLVEVADGAVDLVHTFTLEGEHEIEIGIYPAPDGSRLLVVYRGPSPSLALADVTTGEVVDLADLDPVAGSFAAAWAPDGTQLAIAIGGGLSIVDTSGAVHEPMPPMENDIESLSWSPGGDELALALDDSLIITDPRDESRAQLTVGRVSYQWAPDGTGLYIASSERAADGSPRTIVQRYGPDLIPQGDPVDVPGRRGEAPICFALTDVSVAPGAEASAP